MRGKSLQDCVRVLRGLIGHSLAPAQGQQMQEVLEERLRTAQEWLWESFDWQHLQVERDIQLQAGQRYYAAPADILPERIVCVSTKLGTNWCKLEYGIEPKHLEAFDSDAGVRSSPAYRWEFSETPGSPHTDRIEIWPVPGVDGDPVTLQAYIRIEGQRNLQPFNASSDLCTLDHRLICLHAAIPILARQNQRDAERMSAEADQLRMNLRSRGSQGRVSFERDPHDDYRHRRFEFVSRAPD